MPLLFQNIRNGSFSIPEINSIIARENKFNQLNNWVVNIQARRLSP